MAEINESAPKPPYLSYTTFKNFLVNLEGVIPSRIDKSLMHGQSGTTQSALLNALEFFKLIDDKGLPQDSLQILADAIPNESAYKGVWRTTFLNAYSPIVAGLDLMKATPAELTERFKEYNYGGDTLRKCHVFFIAAAEAGDVILANHLKVVGRPSSTSRRTNTKKVTAQAEVKHAPPEKPVIIPEGMNSAVLPLSSDGSRYFRVEAPLTIRSEELSRIQQWLSFQLILEKETS